MGALTGGESMGGVGAHAGSSAVARGGGSRQAGDNGGTDMGRGGAGAGSAGVGGGGSPQGGHAGGGSLPALPCVAPFIWRADFSSDPTAQDENGDAQPDWVIRGGQPFDMSEVLGGVWRSTSPKAFDTFPPTNFSGRTQARVRMRDTNRTAAASFAPAGYGGALMWLNLDYRGTDYLAVYASISALDGVTRELGAYALLTSPAQLLAGPYPVGDDAFVVVELDVDPETGTVVLWADGVSVPAAMPSRITQENSDQFATIISPQGTAEFDEFWVATCRP